MNSQTQSTLEDVKEQVLRALQDPRWDFRTVEGIAKQIGQPEEIVADALARLGDQVRRSDVPDKQGRAIFTMASRPMKAQERLANLRNFLAKSSS